MADPKKPAKPPAKKKATVVRAKLKPEDPITVVFTLRDPWGSPIPKMKMTMKQSGSPLKAAGGGDIVTDEKGRVVVDKVMPQTDLEIALDDKYVPVDTDPNKTQYVYKLADHKDDVIELEVDDDEDNKLAIVDTKRAYCTLFASVDLFRPKYRFPWQNPYHSEENDDRIYGHRVKSLRFVLRSLFGVTKAAADAMDHTALVNDLIQRYTTSQATIAAAAAAAAAKAHEATTAEPSDSKKDSPEPNTGSDGEPAPPSRPPPSEPPPPSQPAPDSTPAPPVQAAPRAVPIKDTTVPAPPPPAAPAPTPPANAPDAADVDSKELPRWVWYLLFHHTGLRYTAKLNDKDPNMRGAHHCCVKPGFILQAMRLREIDTLFGASAGDPSSDDVTEALVLLERDIPPKSTKLRANLLSADTKVVKAALTSVFKGICDNELKRTDGYRTDDKVYDGDYVALGLLKAKRLKSNTVLTDEVWKLIVSRTQLRNDATGDSLETMKEAARGLYELTALKALMTPVAKGPTIGFDGGQWRERRGKTFDTLLSAAVCDQTSETGELLRSGNTGNGIPGDASNVSSLQYVSFTSAKTFKRGMHAFYLSFQKFAGAGEQPFVSFSNMESTYVPCKSTDPKDPKKVIYELKPMSSLTKITDLGALLDPTNKENKAAQDTNKDRKEMEDLVNKAKDNKDLKTDRDWLKSVSALTAKKVSPGPQSLLPTTVIAKDKKFIDTRLIDARLVGNARLSDKERFVAVRCEDNTDGTGELKVCKWTHEEIVVNVKTEAHKVTVSLFSTASFADGQALGTGIRVYEFPDKAKDGTEYRENDKVYGFVYEKANETSKALLDAVYLNTTTLKLS